MMQKRDLILVSRAAEASIDAFEKEVFNISTIVSSVESLDAFCKANEIIDINRYKIITEPFLVQKTLVDNTKPFVFVCNKN